MEEKQRGEKKTKTGRELHVIKGRWAGEDTGSPSSGIASNCAGRATTEEACVLMGKMDLLVLTSWSCCKTPDGKMHVKH